MLEKYYSRLSPKGKRRALIAAGIRGAIDLAVLGGIMYGACFVVYQLQQIFGVT